MTTSVSVINGFQLGEGHAKLLSETFQWKTKDGQFLKPAMMRTSHLFYTLRMVWNNMMPPHMRVGDVRLYNFGPFYRVPGYLQAAIINLGHELGKRELDPIQLHQLQQMATMLQHPQQVKDARNDF